jgi:hypothetical protein
MEPQSVTGELGPKQQEAINGPIDQKDSEMLTYECKGCSGRFFDIGHYFYSVNSTRCTWCSKFPKDKDARKINRPSNSIA